MAMETESAAATKPLLLLGPPAIRGARPSADASAAAAAPESHPFLDLLDAAFNAPSAAEIKATLKPKKARTENCSATYSASGNPCLDFFFQVVPNTLAERVRELLKAAWAHDPLTTLKLACNLRGVRATGNSDKEGFYAAALWMHDEHPKTLACNVAALAEFGYLKDFPELLFRLIPRRSAHATLLSEGVILMVMGYSAKVKNEAAVLGFVGAPFTLASYCVEGGSSKNFSKNKKMTFAEPEILHTLLQKFTTSMANYIKYQADNGAQAVQIFDSWATELSPVDFEEFSLPYLKQIVDSVKETHPDLPLILYASGSGGLLERLPLTGVDVVSLDWTVDMAEGRKRLGSNIAVQGNVDPGVLFGSKEFITKRIHDTVQKAGSEGHVLNLGHGIKVGTPEENVAHFFEVAKGIRY